MTTNTEHGSIDADKLRELIEFHRDRLPHGVEEDLEALLPTPQPRTLKDMTPEEREACQWMQADFCDGIAERPVRVVITKTRKNSADLILRDGTVHCAYPDNLTPLPDLPRMVWPDEQATAHYDEGMAPEVEEGTYGKPFWEMVTKAIRDEKEYHIDAQDYEGVKRWSDAERALRTAMETNPPKESPGPTRPEDVPEGEAWIVTYLGEEWVGTRASHDGVWSLARMDGEACRYADSCRVTLVSRLVPEDKV